MDNKYRKIYFFSGTHWDREWEQTFQGFRFRLVNMMNELIDTLKSEPEFKVFHFDGQTIMLEDFLEIEPSKSEDLAKLIKDGRILIGPWYVMPDEFLLSGESLIRNLMMGHSISKNWGVEALKYGYICDIFGHIAQMPQIFNGFNINCALLGRGTNEHTTPAHFIWKSPDGSECITFKLPDKNGYGDFSLSPIPKEEDDEKIDALLKEYMENEFKRSDVPITLVMDAIDHAPINKKTVIFLERIQKLYPDAEILHTNIENMGKDVEQYRDRLPVKLGELREPAKIKAGFIHLITHTLSSRYPIKKANDECQILLEKWVEPFMFIAEQNGLNLQKSYVDLAYKHLIQNQPHDSICGCSIDQVHKDMEYRFDQTKMISNQLIDSVINFDCNQHHANDKSNTLAVMLYNLLPFPRNEVVTIDISFPKGYPTIYQEPFGYEEKNSFKIYDYNGREVPYGIVEIKKDYVVRVYNQTVERVDLYTISMEASLPAMGKAEYKIVPFEASSRYLDVLAKESRMAENEYIKLVINDNGTVSIIDKVSGEIYNNLINYLDDGEIGDGWYHANPANDCIVDAVGFPCRIELSENGPSRAVFKITKTMTLPQYMDYHKHGIKRSENLTTMDIISYVGLSKGARFVDVETIINNTAKDHRLKLVLPTNIKSDTYFANQPFTFVERKTGVDFSTQEWKECEVPEKQMNGIVGNRDENGNGLAFISAYGLHECAVMDDNSNYIHVTLFRSFRKTVMTNGEEGGQILGTHQFKYCIMPIQTDTSYAKLIRIKDSIQAQIKAATIRVEDDYEVPTPNSYFEIVGEHICVSIIKRPENGEKNQAIIRLYNMSPNDASAKIVCFKNLVSAHEVNLNEEDMQEYAFDYNNISVNMSGWKIKTFRLVF